MDLVVIALIIIIIALLAIVILFVLGEIVSPRGIRKTFEDDNDTNEHNGT